eukprot:SAG22_NODE_68_length_22846_cov_32.458258_2_plen_324_part_00
MQEALRTAPAAAAAGARAQAAPAGAAPASKLFRVPLELPAGDDLQLPGGLRLPPALDFASLPTAEADPGGRAAAAAAFARRCVECGARLAASGEGWQQLGERDGTVCDSLAVPGCAVPIVRHARTMQGPADVVFDLYSRLNYTSAIDALTFLVQPVEVVPLPPAAASNTCRVGWSGCRWCGRWIGCRSRSARSATLSRSTAPMPSSWCWSRGRAGTQASRRHRRPGLGRSSAPAAKPQTPTGEATVLAFKGSDHCLSLCFSAFPCGSTALTYARCHQGPTALCARSAHRRCQFVHCGPSAVVGHRRGGAGEGTGQERGQVRLR